MGFVSETYGVPAAFDLFSGRLIGGAVCFDGFEAAGIALRCAASDVRSANKAAAARSVGPHAPDSYQLMKFGEGPGHRSAVSRGRQSALRSDGRRSEALWAPGAVERNRKRSRFSAGV